MVPILSFRCGTSGNWFDFSVAIKSLTLIRFDPVFFACFSNFSINREKMEDYLQFFTHAGESRFPIFAWESLRKLGHFVN